MFNFEPTTILHLKPFKHVVIDNFMATSAAESLFNLFPAADSSWYEYNNVFEKKNAEDRLDKMPLIHKGALFWFNSIEFIKPIEDIFGIQGLVPDPWYRGGGLHQIKRGGKLDIHADFNIHPKLKLQRKLNAILYLNKDWDESWGGHLELWEKDMSKCAKKIAPLFNRLVVFETSDDSFHGHPEPLNCPENVTRKSMALYYYVKPEENVKPHSTLFKKRPQDETSEEIEQFRIKRGTARS